MYCSILRNSTTSPPVVRLHQQLDYLWCYYSWWVWTKRSVFVRKRNHEIHCLKETAACVKYTVSKKQLRAWYTLSQRNSCLHEIHCLKETAACMIYTVSKKQLPAWKKAELCCCNPLLHVCRSAIYLDLHDTQLNSAQLPSTLWLAATVCSTSSHYSPKLCTHAWLITTLQHSTIVVAPNQRYHTVAL